MSDLQRIPYEELEAESDKALSSKSTQRFIEIEEEKLRRKGAPSLAELQSRASRGATHDQRPRFFDGPLERFLDRGPWLLVKIALTSVAIPTALVLLSAFLSSTIPGCENVGGEVSYARYSGCVVLGVDLSWLVANSFKYGYFGFMVAAGYLLWPLMLAAGAWGALRRALS